MNYKLRILVISLLLPLIGFGAVTTVTQATAGSYNFVPPFFCNVVTVKLWGGGGSGGGIVVNNTQARGGGAAGGSYAQSDVTVTPGTTYPYVVAAVRAGGTGDGTKGYSSTFNTSTVIAEGGALGQGYANGYQPGLGTTAGCTGTIKYKGGDGIVGGTGTTGGAGGGGAGTTNNGGTGSGNTAGAGTSLSGGNGGAGRSSSGNGNTGSDAGGGGGSGGNIGTGSTSDRTGGQGAQGRAEISYTTPGVSKVNNLAIASIKSYCGCTAIQTK